MKIVIDSAIPFVEGLFEPYATVLRRPGSQICRDDVRDADALIIRTRTRCDAALLEGSQVSIIATATIGFDHIDLDYCYDHGIEVATAAGCNARGVLQWVAATLALLARRDGFAPKERTLGIVGVGNVGRLVEQYGRAWGFRVICCDPPREERERLGFVELDELLQQADIVTFHVPLDATTHHLLNRQNIHLVRPGATIINASRGEVIDTETLLERDDLTCALDVWEHEPNIDTTLLQRAIVTTPHIAGYSRQGKANAAAMVVESVARRLDLPIEGWYPPTVERPTPRDISWSEMCESIAHYCDLPSESATLKGDASQFEALRNDYRLRDEYF